MLRAKRSYGGMVTAPHHLASQAGLKVLDAGGNALEAAVATAAALAVVYPHMNSIGGDGFWLIARPNDEPIGIDASGRAAARATDELYAGMQAIPWRGGLAANTVAGTVSGWQAALALSRGWGGGMSIATLLADAIRFAREGVAVVDDLAAIVASKQGELAPSLGFSEVFTPDGERLVPGQKLRQPALGRTLTCLAEAGLDDFYRGDVAEALARDLAWAESPLTLADLAAHEALLVKPLEAQLSTARLYNLPAPTQGIASLLILSLFDRMGVQKAESFEHLHGLIEATKPAFRLRDRLIGDPYWTEALQPHLKPASLETMLRPISMTQAAPWPVRPSGGDTVWLGVIDRQGWAVSMIQSTYFEFGSGVVLPSTGVTWQNRGCSFRLTGEGPNRLRPGAKPFHTLNPAMARFEDGRTMVYGTMGGEGQPQTQAAIFSRYGLFGQDLQDAVSGPRWLLGKTWGETSTTLKLEDRFDADLVTRLSAAGHAVEMVAPYTGVMGHAGAIVRHADGSLIGAADPRSDGAVAAR